MQRISLEDWIRQFSSNDFLWFAKRLSANDTLATQAHQAGPYIPKEFLFKVLPVLKSSNAPNPSLTFQLIIDSHDDRRDIRAVWYNNKFRGGTRDETRLTGFGGASSPLLDPSSTGSLAVFAFQTKDIHCHVWVCEDLLEEQVIEDLVGPVEPGRPLVWSAQAPPTPLGGSPKVNCWLKPEALPTKWLIQFPSGEEIIRKTIGLRPETTLPVDRRLLRRRDCEFQLFRSLEEAVELPVIRKGFGKLEDFLARAQTILQRRKARSGRSLELHTKALFGEAGMSEGVDFVHQARESDAGKRGPDFLFPSTAAYTDRAFPADRLRMLAVKTTCKDRWRQILTEADRIGKKHLLTLQEGVSEPQFQEMSSAGVQLVVPEPLHESFPKSVRPYLQSVDSFIAEIRSLNPKRRTKP